MNALMCTLTYRAGRWEKAVAAYKRGQQLIRLDDKFNAEQVRMLGGCCHLCERWVGAAAGVGTWWVGCCCRLSRQGSLAWVGVAEGKHGRAGRGGLGRALPHASRGRTTAPRVALHVGGVQCSDP